MAFDNECLNKPSDVAVGGKDAFSVEELRKMTKDAIDRQNEENRIRSENFKKIGREVARTIIEHLPKILEEAARKGEYEAKVLIVVDELLHPSSRNENSRIYFKMLLEVGKEGRDEAAKILTEYLESRSFKVWRGKEFGGCLRVENLVLYAGWLKEPLNENASKTKPTFYTGDPDD